MGKTTTFIKMFLYQWVNQFDLVYIFCPTFKNDNLWGNVDKYTHTGQIKVYTYFKESVVESLFKKQCKLKEKGSTKQILFYFDDCGSESGFKNMSEHSIINKLASQGNHANCSTIACVQKLKQLTTTFRLNAEAFMTFYVSSELERKAIYEDFGLPVKYGQFRKILNDCTKEKYHQYYVNRQGAGEPIFYHNFKRIKLI